MVLRTPWRTSPIESPGLSKFRATTSAGVFLRPLDPLAIHPLPIAGVGTCRTYTWSECNPAPGYASLFGFSAHVLLTSRASGSLGLGAAAQAHLYVLGLLAP